MPAEGIYRLAVPGVCILIAFLAYGSQVLFPKLDPGPLTSQQKWIFNIMVGGIWICYARAITTDPGSVPTDWSSNERSKEDQEPLVRQRHCRKCEAVKPPRVHHCKVCQRCIPKMDHHCPWTANCVSHFTFPHFLRFLFYAVASMTYLERLLYERAAAVWNSRDLRYDLGPTVTQLVMLFVMIVVNTLTLFMVGITFFRAFYALCCNVSTIESWEIERHEQLCRRARVFGGFLDGPDGIKVRIAHQEFPYDIGIWRNICVGMGTRNFLAWLWPLSRTPGGDGLTFETNGFEDPGTTWPPPDPDRMPRIQRSHEAMDAFTHQHQGMTDREQIEAFQRRQQEDISRRLLNQRGNGSVQRRKTFHERFEPETYSPIGDDMLDADADSSGEEGWQDSGGNRLKDYGVDEDFEFYDEDDVPLAELLRRRQENRASGYVRPTPIRL